MSKGIRSVRPFRNPMPMQITSSQCMVLIRTIEIAVMLPRSRSGNQETMISSNVSEEGSAELDRRLSRRMSMRSCPSGKGSQT